MSLQGQAPTGQPASPPAGKPPARRNPILSYIEDSYNGLYKIVLEPSMPTKQTVILLIVGLIIGLIWGWAIKPVQFYDATPNQMSQIAQDAWIKSVAVAHDTQTFYPDERAKPLLLAVPDPASAVNRMLQDPNIDAADASALQSLKPLTDTIVASDTPEPVKPRGIVDDLISLLLPIIIIVVATPILVVVWRLLIYDNLIAPIIQRIHEARNPQDRAKRLASAADRQRIKEQQDAGKKLREQEEKDRLVAVSEGRGDAFGAPVMQALYIYSKGRSFDESSEIELKTGEFLGQCGAVIAEAVDPDPTAVEVWLFDMFDQVNLKKVLITETAYGNPSIRAAVEDSVENPNEDIIVAKPGTVVTLETQKLRLQAKLPAVTVAQDGRFENFNMQMQAWDKSKMGAGVSAPAPVAVAPLTFDAPPAPRPMAPLPPAPLPARPMSDYNDLQFDPPPAAPLRPSAPAPLPPAQSRPLSDYDNMQFDPPPMPRQAPVQPLHPSAPPPAAPGFGDEDDPFGNTGDFTPLGSGR